jgi:hypothetical protein
MMERERLAAIGRAADVEEKLNANPAKEGT